MKTLNITLRRNRTRAKIHGTAARPRLSVHLSNRHVLAQLIDDDKGVTLAFISTVGQKALTKKTMIEKATWVGEQMAAKAKSAKVSTVVFDRGERIYHGRVQALAEAARKNGLKF